MDEQGAATGSRRCSGCGRGLAMERFPARGRRCLDCRRARAREHYRANRSYYVRKARVRQAVVIAEVREWLLAYLRDHPCVDCGQTDVRTLEFDHRDDEQKVLAVAVLARSGYSLERVKAEVAKCDVRCANCHRIRTHQQRGWWGAGVVLARPDLEATEPLSGEKCAPGGIRTPKPSDP